MSSPASSKGSCLQGRPSHGRRGFQPLNLVGRGGERSEEGMGEERDGREGEEVFKISLRYLEESVEVAEKHQKLSPEP